jgi:hypothetical protein
MTFSASVFLQVAVTGLILSALVYAVTGFLLAGRAW